MKKCATMASEIMRPALQATNLSWTEPGSRCRIFAESWLTCETLVWMR